MERTEPIKEIFYETVKPFVESDIRCDLGLVQKFINNLELQGYEVSEYWVSTYLKALRVYNFIDDIFLKLLLELTELHYALEADTHSSNMRNSYYDYLETNNLENLFAEFTEFPDEEQVCAIGAFYRLKNNSRNKKGNRIKEKELKYINKLAYSENMIPLESFNRIETLRRSDILERRIFLSGYLDKTFYAKDLLIPREATRYDIEVDRRDDYVVDKMGWFNNTTRREYLYNKYSDKQLIVLANILRKASIRMGVDADFSASIPEIRQEFVYRNEEGEEQTFVEVFQLSTSNDHVEYALRRMRMDIIEAQMYESFGSVEIKYEDIVLAALETGYITHEEVGLALTYDDIWNKEESKLMQAAKLTMRVGGTAVFYLPPPYNVIGAIGVALINAKIINKPKGEDNDNPYSIFN